MDSVVKLDEVVVAGVWCVDSSMVGIWDCVETSLMKMRVVSSTFVIIISYKNIHILVALM